MLIFIDTVSKQSKILLKRDNITNSKIILLNNKIQISDSIIFETIKIFSKYININEIKEIAVCTGPGSFTGLRIGIAAAIGLKIALNINLYGVDVFNTLLKYARFNYSNKNVHILIHSDNNQKFYAVFDENNNFLIKPKKIDDIKNFELINKDSILISNEKFNLFNKKFQNVIYKEISELILSYDYSIYSNNKKIIKPTYVSKYN